MSGTIREFQGPYRFLSNFWYAEVEYAGEIYPTVEHAYQAAKATDPAVRKRLMGMTPGQAKRAALLQRPDWSTVRVAIMEDLVRQKFTRHHRLRAALLRSGERELQEGNTWGDRFWGMVNGVGENHLGRILMRVRAELRADMTLRALRMKFRPDEVILMEEE